MTLELMEKPKASIICLFQKSVNVYNNIMKISLESGTLIIPRFSRVVYVISGSRLLGNYPYIVYIWLNCCNIFLLIYCYSLGIFYDLDNNCLFREISKGMKIRNYYV